MAAKGTTLSFKNWHKTFKCPFVVYADLEAFDVKTEDFDLAAEQMQSGLNSGGASTTVIENQYPCSFGVVLVDVRLGHVKMEKFYRGDDCIAVLMNTLRSWVRWADTERQRFRFLNMSKTRKQEMLQNWMEPCCICHKSFSGELHDSSEEKVVHHCHVTGKIFGVAHNSCNLKVTVGSFLPVFFHNLSRYDAHHIVKYLKLEDNEQLSAISRTEETFISFSVHVPVRSYINKAGVEKTVRHEIRFLDSINFMASSLDALAKTLQDSDLKLLRHRFQHFNDNEFKKIRAKGIFPYSFLDSKEKFQAALPEYGEEWRNTLTGKIDVTPEMYSQGVEMYQLLECRYFGDYHDAYLQIDVYLLADVFELFRTVCISVYRLDPAYFYSAPNLSWDAMLVTTEVQLSLLDDIDMLLFCEKAIRGGLNGVGALRHFKANNKYLSTYNPDQVSVYGAFFDVTSLYARIMMKMLPKDGYQWLECSSVEELFSKYEADNNVGFFVEVDLTYPPAIHDKHYDFPLAPEKLFIKDDWLSPYSKKFAGNRAPVPKLVETLFDKRGYICHIENLKFYCSQGPKVTALHRVLQFNQSNWLSPYIEKNTEMRKKAATPFEKNFYKLMSIACFGKTMENKRNRKNVQFVSEEFQAKKLTAKPTFKSFRIINEHLCSV